jgi:hypothetical protein
MTHKRYVMFYSRETENKNYKRVTLPDKSSLSIFEVVGFVQIGKNKTALRTARRLVVRGRPPGRAVGRTGATQAHAASVRSVSSNRVLIVTVPLARISALSRQSKPFKHLLTFLAAPRNQFLHELAHLLLI